MTNRLWVTLLYFLARQSSQSCLNPWPTASEWHWFISLLGSFIMSHHMTNSGWVIAQFLHRNFSYYVSTASEWHCFTSLPGSLINHVSSHDQQSVSDTALLLSNQAVSSIMSCPMTNREWVTLLYLFARQSYQSCLIPWPTGGEWHCFISLPGSLINHISSHDWQRVSSTALFLSEAVLSIMSHPMTNSLWVTHLYFLTGSLNNYVSPHDQ